MLGRDAAAGAAREGMLMAGAGAGAMQMPPEEAAAMAALLTGGAGGLPPVDPMMGGAPVAPAPAAPGPIPGFPSTDPATIAQLRAADHAALDAAQDNAMAMGAQMMGGPAPAPAAPGTPPLGGDPFAPPMPAQVPLGDPTLGAGPPTGMPLPPELAMALGGPDMGAMESESVAQLPGADFAAELGAY